VRAKRFALAALLSTGPGASLWTQCRSIGAILSAVAVLSGNGVARAVGLYGAELTAQLTITGFFDAAGTPIPRPGDLVIEGESALFDQFLSTTANATADAPYTAAVQAADPLALQVGDGLDQRAAASGSVFPPPAGSSEALARTNGLLFLDNRSMTETFRMGFELTYEWSLDVSLDDPGTEAARADVTLLLESLSGGTLLGFFEEAVAGFSAGSRSDAGTFSGELVLAPLDFDELGLVADATGATTAVPEPSSLMLLVVAAIAALSARAGSAARPS
jgi:hypothetical protein